MRRILVALFATALLAGCMSGTKVKSAWVADGFAAKRPSKIVVIGIAPDDIKRQQFEDALAARLTDGTSSRTLIPLAELLGMANAQTYLRDRGFDGALVVRVVSAEQHHQAMPEHGAMVSGGTSSIRGTFDLSVYSKDANYVLHTNTVVLQTELFRLDTSERLFSASTSTFNAQEMDTLAGELFEAIGKALRKQGVN